jgi:hypothetical protein
MSDFKIGDKAVRILCFTSGLPTGYVTKVLENSMCTDINGVKRDFWAPFWELVPKDIEPTPVTKPTMADLFALDIKDSSGFLTTHDINDLIAKGWKK